MNDEQDNNGIFDLNDSGDSGTANYTEENITTLEWQEHIRRRPGMYIGKLGDGSGAEDGIYVLLKEVLDNSDRKSVV